MLPSWVVGLQTHLGIETHFAVENLKMRGDEDGVTGGGTECWEGSSTKSGVFGVRKRVIVVADEVWRLWCSRRRSEDEQKISSNVRC